MTTETTIKVKTTRQLSNIAADWLEASGGLQPLTPDGGFPRNLAHKIEWISESELVITNTEGEIVRFVVKVGR